MNKLKAEYKSATQLAFEKMFKTVGLDPMTVLPVKHDMGVDSAMAEREDS